MKQLLSDNVETIASAISTTINNDAHSTAKQEARKGVDYYEGRHDILKNRIFYIDDDGALREDKFASNIRIPHQFLTEQIDQKTQYLLANGLEYETDDETLKTYLAEYYDEDFELFLQEIVEGGSQKGFEYAYARTNNADKLCFQVADALNVIPVYDETNEVKRFLRHYKKDIIKDGKTVQIIIAEVWTDKETYYFTSEDGKEFKFDKNREFNPRPHVLAKVKDGTIAKRDYGRLPFYRYSNNKKEFSDLKPIKSLIDDYDLMNAFLSNNLQDFSEAIYVVSGFQGDDLSKLRQNIKAKKTVGVGTNGSVDVKTVQIPTEGRKLKMDIDKENIYKFGMAFDSTQIGDGNITNIVIKSRYTLLDMKANKTEVRVRTLLKWINEMVINDINRRYNSRYSPDDVSFIFTREAMVNENDVVSNEKIMAETRDIIIKSILQAAPRLDDETVLRLICEQFELDWEEVLKAIESQEYTSGLDEASEPAEVLTDDNTEEQMGTGTGTTV